MDELDKIIE